MNSSADGAGRLGGRRMPDVSYEWPVLSAMSDRASAVDGPVQPRTPPASPHEVIHTDVLLVGMGPVGAALATLLAAPIESLDDSVLPGRVAPGWAVIVRPDRYVFAEGPVTDVDAIVQLALDRMGAPPLRMANERVLAAA